MLEVRIQFLAGLLDKYDINYLNTRYKEIELGYVLEDLNKTKYSVPLQKRMIAEAKKKSISPSRKAYIQTLIEKNIQFKEEAFFDLFYQAVEAFFKNNVASLKALPGIGMLFFGHGYDSKITTANIYGAQSEEGFIDALLSLKTSINFKPIWGFIEERKFSSMSENLEIIEVEGEEYPLIFNELFKLRGYKILKEVFNSKEISSLIQSLPLLETFKIEVGEYHNWSYEVFKLKA